MSAVGVLGKVDHDVEMVDGHLIGLDKSSRQYRYSCHDLRVAEKENGPLHYS